MYKQLKAHYALMQSRLGSLTREQARELLDYHVVRVRDFQHERLIHLLVTLFFGMLLIVSVMSLFIAPQNTGVTLLLSVITLLLFVTELGYVIHYYHLENGVQKLYTITEELYRRING